MAAAAAALNAKLSSAGSKKQAKARKGGASSSADPKAPVEDPCADVWKSSHSRMHSEGNKRKAAEFVASLEMPAPNADLAPLTAALGQVMMLLRPLMSSVSELMVAATSPWGQLDVDGLEAALGEARRLYNCSGTRTVAGFSQRLVPGRARNYARAYHALEEAAQALRAEDSLSKRYGVVQGLSVFASLALGLLYGVSSYTAARVCKARSSAAAAAASSAPATPTGDAPHPAGSEVCRTAGDARLSGGPHERQATDHSTQHHPLDAETASATTPECEAAVPATFPLEAGGTAPGSPTTAERSLAAQGGTGALAPPPGKPQRGEQPTALSGGSGAPGSKRKAPRPPNRTIPSPPGPAPTQGTPADREAPQAEPPHRTPTPAEMPCGASASASASAQDDAASAAHAEPHAPGGALLARKRARETKARHDAPTPDTEPTPDTGSPGGCPGALGPAAAENEAPPPGQAAPKARRKRARPARPDQAGDARPRKRARKEVSDGREALGPAATPMSPVY